VLISGEGVKTDESALTGEPEPMKKSSKNPFMISGTVVNSGQGTMLVVAVGEHSISGKIKKKVYAGEQAEESPLFKKLDNMATVIGKGGTLVAFICFCVILVKDLAIPPRKSPWYKVLVHTFIHAIGILAVAIPEGLPLALTISLAFSSNRMSYEANLVKTLDSCETMGSATTICTDKTGTLTANRMTVRGAQIAGSLFKVKGAEAVGPRVKADTSLPMQVKELLGNLLCVCSMDESGFDVKDGITTFHGNPTECALLKFAEEFGFDYKVIRATVRGRSPHTRDDGCVKAFSSNRKMMSWAVPRPGGGFRVFAKGASEIILERVTTSVQFDGAAVIIGDVEKGRPEAVSEIQVNESEKKRLMDEVISPFANQAMRTIALAYKDIDELPTADTELHPEFQNTDGSPAFLQETDLVLVAIVGIEDPLRGEVPGAIQRCFQAGIDVRMVTGDNLATAIAIARGAGILNEQLHFDKEGVLLPKCAMEGKVFRKAVHDYSSDGEPIFRQDKFDEIWPYLRVLARSSPEDKLTLATGLHQSMLFKDDERVKELQQQGVTIFPDRQVIAMTGDGTNDAPALKYADIGFAMGISGTQIAKDAANIILLDDNFASIVTAAKWGRNVFDSIQKFLQFQLTVNIAICVLSLITAFIDMEKPLTVLQLLWLNLIMDSLASLALASEPPTEAQLKRPPVNRSASIITEQMWFNMLGQSVYQVIVVIILMFQRDWLPGVDEGPLPHEGPYSRHYTIIFNSFVLMQVFNEYNSRKLEGEWNILSGIQNNRLFIVVSLATMTLQVIIVQALGVFGEKAFSVHRDGLTGVQWLVCLAFGAGPLVWQQIINVLKWVLDTACSGVFKSRGFGGKDREKKGVMLARSSSLIVVAPPRGNGV